MALKSWKLVRFLSSNQKSPLWSSTTCHLLQTRAFIDSPQSSIDPYSVPPPIHEKIPAQESGGFSVGSSPISSSMNELEIAKFSAMAETWWDSQGAFKPLHAMNPTRVAFIRSTLCRHFRKDLHSDRPFEGLQILDVGCGGGILSEPLARMGATVTGVDAIEKNIKIARLHAESDPVTSSIEYCHGTAEMLAEEQREFDVVIALEVIEHITNPAGFCKTLGSLTISNGATLISTSNRSIRSFATVILAAEYLLQWLPRGTHQWSRFLTPEDLALVLNRSSISLQEIAGFMYNPLTGRWALSDDLSANYIAFGTKNYQ